MQEAYADLEIRILALQDEGYPVEITFSGEQEFPRGYLRAGILPWVPSASPLDDGERLFRALFADPRLSAAWAEARGHSPLRRVRLRIDASAPELHLLPWELLRDPGDGQIPQTLAACVATPFSRYVAGTWQPGSPIMGRPIRILIAIASPQDLDAYHLPAIDVEKEWTHLQEATGGLDVELVQLPQPCTLSSLAEELRRGYHILHFMGHGSYQPRDGQATLYMADRDNCVALERGPELAEMLARQLADTSVRREDKLRLICLASCHTASRSARDAFCGLAPRLVAAGVPAVLAMQGQVPADTARTFAVTFYRQLLQHGLVDLAANEARSALLTSHLPAVAAPVLFLRLRSGALLGQRGHITSEREDMFWPFLLENIELGQCTPFLGPRVNAGLLPSNESAAAWLADKYGYPLPDKHNLVRVAQYLALSDPGLLRREYLHYLQLGLYEHLALTPTREQAHRTRTASLTKTIASLDWAERVLSIHEDEIHHLLADLHLPLYITTNYDSFMAEALEHEGLQPRREGPRWEPQAGSPQYVLSPPPGPERPVVFHLNGHDGDMEQQEHLVLSEDDYLAHLVRLCRDQDALLPMNVVRELSRHSFIFLGYALDDWDFRIILHGLLRSIAQAGAPKLHVGVQLEVERNPNAAKVVDYLRRYLGRFNIEIYWGTPQQFVTELHARWQAYLEAEADEWRF